jgi:alpha-tubulin suppressor-like RCC1 family protein
MNYSRPTPVAPFTRESLENFTPLVSVSCGSYHSLAVDHQGHVWSWGALGGPCLGHPDVPLEGDWLKRLSTIFSEKSKLSKVMVRNF